MMSISRGTLWIACLLGILGVSGTFLATQAHAQVGLPGIESSVLITYSPTYPSPGDTVHLEARSSVLDLEQADIVWRMNGKTVAQGKGVTSANITVGAVGVMATIEISVAAQDDIAASAVVRIVPTELDLLVDSDSYIPLFYRGRAFASTGTNLRLQAIPHFKRSSGTYVADANINFTWKKNGEILGSVSGLGKSSAIIPAEHLFGTDRISVEARSTDGLLVNEASFSFSPTEPILLLYKSHPLFGVMYHEALGNAAFIPDSEMTFVAVPYFAQTERAESPLLMYAWRVNGRAVLPSTASPNALTISAVNSSGKARIDLSLTHRTNYYLNAEGSWNITFSADSSVDQFRNFSQ